MRREGGYKCTDTVKQRMIPGGNNDKWLTNIGTNLSHTYICQPLIIASSDSVAALVSMSAATLLSRGGFLEVAMTKG